MNPHQDTSFLCFSFPVSFILFWKQNSSLFLLSKRKLNSFFFNVRLCIPFLLHLIMNIFKHIEKWKELQREHAHTYHLESIISNLLCLPVTFLSAPHFIHQIVYLKFLYTSNVLKFRK